MLSDGLQRRKRRMSALGQKQTCAAQKVMSALPPIADMCSAQAHVCFVPIADIAPARSPAPLLHLPLEREKPE